ncbi:hypothetical protein PsYK624_154350 [Phanerochaete sordida]|uniref:Uncharacterized protein n=1 Tax=Phanerochaete sordida TaxID=48140 RepID=A0A9P3GPJ4_9APHY|nr:hypothetical protein PsYK624_154350 [Phanerochaete sordida]
MMLPDLPLDDLIMDVAAHSAAHRVPIEVFTRIMKHALGVISNRDDERRKRKQFLGKCSLVCTYWAKHLRPYVCQYLNICTRDDAEQLLEFAKITTLGTSIGLCVEGIKVSWTIPSPPWAHLVLHLLPRHLFPNLKSIMMTVSKDTSLDSARNPFVVPRTPFQGLPRTLPFPSSRYAVAQSADALHFNTFEKLASFSTAPFLSPRKAQEQRQLLTLGLVGVTWEEENQIIHRPLPDHIICCWKRPSLSFSIHATARCIPWQLVHFFLCSIMSPPAQPSQNETHAATVVPPDAVTVVPPRCSDCCPPGCRRASPSMDATADITQA